MGVFCLASREKGCLGLQYADIFSQIVLCKYQQSVAALPSLHWADNGACG